MAAEIVAAGGVGGGRHQRRVAPRRARRRSWPRRSTRSAGSTSSINNAGIIRWAGFPEVDEDNLARHLAVHTVGSFNTARAAWPHMVDAGYGRIVMTTSSGMFGLPTNISYATAKAGVIGLTRSLAMAGAAHGIKVNLIAPAAVTRMAGGAGPSAMAPELVAPMAAYPGPRGVPGDRRDLRGRCRALRPPLHRLRRGYVHPGAGRRRSRTWPRTGPTINDESGYMVPSDLMSWSARFMDHLDAAD